MAGSRYVVFLVREVRVNCHLLPYFSTVDDGQITEDNASANYLNCLVETAGKNMYVQLQMHRTAHKNLPGRIEPPPISSTLVDRTTIMANKGITRWHPCSQAKPTLYRRATHLIQYYV